VPEDSEDLLDADEELPLEGALAPLSPDAPDFDLEPKPGAYDEEEIEEEEAESEPLRLERERRRRARIAKMEPEAEEEPAPRPPRRRAAIVAHGDPDSVASAVLLARDLRLYEGIWIYPQSELMTFFRSVATDLREETPIYVIGFTASPAREILQTASLYRDRITWFDHHEWPPEDLEGLRGAIGEEAVQVTPGVRSSLPSVLSVCTRRSRFSDKLVDLVTGRFSAHDYERWGRLWWARLVEMSGRAGERKADLEPLIIGRPSDLAREAARADAPSPPPEATFAAERDFRLVHFGGSSLVVVPVPLEFDLALAARIVRERYGARLSLAYPEGAVEGVLVLGADELSGQRSLDLGAMVEHLAGKFGYLEPLPDADHVARFRVRDLGSHPDRLDEVVAEIGMGRSVLEG
jgi:hypothetical protein